MRDNSTILHRLQLWAHDQPNQVALYFKDPESNWKSITAETYWLQAVRFALALQEFGVGSGDRVILYALNSPEWVQWEMGIWLAGAISVGVHPNTTNHDLGLMIDQVEPKLILVESEIFRERIHAERSEVQGIYTFFEIAKKVIESVTLEAPGLKESGERLLRILNPENCQMIIFTSGTTGTPKGVMLGLSQLTFVADSLSREWQLPFMEGHLFSFLPLAHVAEKIQTLAVAIGQRYPVWFNSKYERFFPELREVRPTLLLAVPRVWERFKEQVENQKPKLLQRVMEIEKVGQIAERLYLSQVKESLGLEQLKIAVSGAAKLPPAIGKWFAAIGIEIQEIYGMSESSGLISMTHSKRTEFTSVGVAPIGVEIKIAIDGEIQVRGPNVFLGYWKDEVGTREVLLDEGWLKTGDLGEWNKELHIIGRNRDIIKLSNGRMVAPLPIENALKEIPEISNVCVVGEGKPSILPLITLKEEVLMEYRFSPGAIEGLSVEHEGLKKKISAQIEELIKAKKIAEAIPQFVILSRDFLVDQQELTQTQKLNRNRIQKNFKHFIDLRFEA